MRVHFLVLFTAEVQGSVVFEGFIAAICVLYTHVTFAVFLELVAQRNNFDASAAIYKHHAFRVKAFAALCSLQMQETYVSDIRAEIQTDAR